MSFNSEEELLQRLDDDIETIKEYTPFILYKNLGLDGDKINKSLNKIQKNIKNNKISKILNEDIINE